MLIAASSTRLLVWNVLSETLLTTIWVEVDKLIADPMSEYMAIFTPNNDCQCFVFCVHFQYLFIIIFLFVVYIFTPNSKTAIYKKQNIFGKNNKNTSILWALFVPKSDHQNGQNSSWSDNSTLYMLTNQQVITYTVYSQQTCLLIIFYYFRNF